MNSRWLDRNKCPWITDLTYVHSPGGHSCLESRVNIKARYKLSPNALICTLFWSEDWHESKCFRGSRWDQRVECCAWVRTLSITPQFQLHLHKSELETKTTSFLSTYQQIGRLFYQNKTNSQLSDSQKQSSWLGTRHACQHSQTPQAAASNSQWQNAHPRQIRRNSPADE